MKLIDEETLTRLLQAEAELTLLTKNGMDNWNGWEEAMQGGYAPGERDKKMVRLMNGSPEVVEESLKDFQDA